MLTIDKAKLINVRRELHKNAEVGFLLPKTRKIIKNYLDSLNIDYYENQGGIYGELLSINHPDEKFLLLRADMDALEMREQSGLAFQSKSDYSHACGHDIHTTILLGCLEYLKNHRERMNKNIVFLFQSNEEEGLGAKKALDGIEKNIGLEKIDEVLALHVNAKSPLGIINYGYGKTFASNDNFKIAIEGLGGHAARPYETQDSLHAAAQLVCMLYSAFQRELNPFDHNLFSITSILCPENSNSIPQKVYILGTLRTYDEDKRRNILQRLRQITRSIATALRVKSDFLTLNSIPGVITNEKFTENILESIRKSNQLNIGSSEVKLGSEDFAYLSKVFPKCAYLFIGAGKNAKEGYNTGQHNPSVIFNEEAIFIGMNCILSYSVR